MVVRERASDTGATASESAGELGQAQFWPLAGGGFALGGPVHPVGGCAFTCGQW